MSLWSIEEIAREVRLRWKIILKKAMESILPQKILTCPKWGFGAPVKAWINKGLSQTVADVYLNSKAVELGLVTEAGVQDWIERTKRSTKRFISAQKLWTLLVFEVRCRVFLNRNIVSAPIFTLDELKT